MDNDFIIFLGSAKDVANEKGDDNGDKPNMTLGDIAKINTNINNTRADDLQTLYMVINYTEL